ASRMMPPPTITMSYRFPDVTPATVRLHRDTGRRFSRTGLAAQPVTPAPGAAVPPGRSRPGPLPATGVVGGGHRQDRATRPRGEMWEPPARHARSDPRG